MTMKPQKMKKWMTPTRSLNSFLWPKTSPTKPSGAGDRAVEPPFRAADHDVLHPPGDGEAEDRQGDHEDHYEDGAVDSHRKTPASLSGYYDAALRRRISSVSAGTTVNRSPTTPKSAKEKIGASGSLLMATMYCEVCMPARCWMAPEMPQAM